MKTPRVIAFEFADVVPSAREEGKLYVSIKYRTAIHSCFCGCGMKVVTPIRPTGWRLAYDGDTVSLHPSVGNWSFACQSHYWITNNQVIPAGPMSQEEIESGRRRDREMKDAYLGETLSVVKIPSPGDPTNKRRTFLERLFGR
jgi:Family of unknown function (DUF6527)